MFHNFTTYIEVKDIGLDYCNSPSFLNTGHILADNQSDETVPVAIDLLVANMGEV